MGLMTVVMMMLTFFHDGELPTATSHHCKNRNTDRINEHSAAGSYGLTLGFSWTQETLLSFLGGNFWEGYFYQKQKCTGGNDVTEIQRK